MGTIYSKPEQVEEKTGLSKMEITRSTRNTKQEAISRETRSSSNRDFNILNPPSFFAFGSY